jgi:hypothetical protein
MNKINHFKEMDDILKYIKKNPQFISGFTSGEGCFTAYMGIDTSLSWGLSPNCEFSITQNSGDLLLLEAFNRYFDGVGKVYDKKDGVHVYMIRNIIDIKKCIIPFFVEYPLVGTKSYEFEKFMNLIELILSKKHVSPNPKPIQRDIFIEMAYICKDLNSKMVNPKKIARLDFIIDWLKNVKNTPPTLTEKEYLKNKLSVELKLYKRSNKVL